MDLFLDMSHYVSLIYLVFRLSNFIMIFIQGDAIITIQLPLKYYTIYILCTVIFLFIMSLQTNLYEITTTIFIYIFQNQYLSYKNNYFVLDTYVRKDISEFIDNIFRGASEVMYEKYLWKWSTMFFKEIKIKLQKCTLTSTL